MFFSLLSTLSVWAAPGIPAAPDKYEQVRMHMHGLVAQQPERARIVTIGESDSGRAVEGIAIGNGPVKNLVVATHHGNEYGSTEVAKAFAASLLEAPISGQTVYVVPVLNIGGYNQGRRYESSIDGRSHDPNRDYPGPCGSEGPFGLKSTAGLARFVEQEGIVGSAALHTYSPAVVYPWGFSTNDLSTPYDDLYKMLVQAATVESKYQTGNSTEVIYAADGTYEDYVFWKHGVWSLLFELGKSHSPSPAAVQEMIRVNVPGLRRMFEQTPRERAERHDFTGKCLARLKALDRHDE
ncbi:MAG: carboxypeptidase [Bdellovibrionales bacterium GWB1_52_6]|nr:MAG: carboxypeptidase [Bdellovibrionales bacterium GWB1_52_6]OFZ02668.1 MAG: carboxypeptidase [Bdellovibrionales bacterium GWA1_52_35]